MHNKNYTFWQSEHMRSREASCSGRLRGKSNPNPKHSLVPHTLCNIVGYYDLVYRLSNVATKKAGRSCLFSGC